MIGTKEQCDTPVSILELAEVIGFDAALTLVASLPRAGKRTQRRAFSVPKGQVKPTHWLLVRLGSERMRRLQYEFGGMVLQPSNGHYWVKRVRDRRILEYAAQDMPVTEIAQRLAVSVDVVKLAVRRKPPMNQSPDAT